MAGKIPKPANPPKLPPKGNKPLTGGLGKKPNRVQPKGVPGNAVTSKPKPGGAA